jgi:hypothetical protein
MKQVMHALALMLPAMAAVWPSSASAGALYGTVRLGEAPLPGARVLLACPSFAARQAAAETATDGGGGFALRVTANGRCEMHVERGNQVGPNFPVYVSDNPVRLDFAVDPGLARAR